MWWWIILGALLVAISYRVGAYVALRRAGHDIRWQAPISRLWRKTADEAQQE